MGMHDEAKLDTKFVGYRTWSGTRFVRKHSLYTFSNAVKRGNAESIASCLGHAKRTASFRYMQKALIDLKHTPEEE